MAEEMTLEKIQKARKDRTESLEKNLKNSFYLDVLGINDLRKEASVYGSLGESIGSGQYAGTMTSENATKLRNQLYKDEMSDREGLGIADMPEYTSNYQISRYVLGIQNESFGELPLGSLEAILGETAKGFKLNVPQQLKDYEAAKQNQIENYIAQGKSAEEIKSLVQADEDSEKAIATLRKVAYTAFRRGAALRVMEAHRYDDINSATEKVAQAYKKAKGIEEPEDQPAAA